MITLAIVEDHELYRDMLGQVVNANNNFELLGIYASAEEALTGLTAAPPDIAIVDIELKGKSGIDLIRQTRTQLPNTQFLICTSYQDNDNVFNALKAGASGYIVKGASATEIQDAITELHNGGAPMSPYIARKVISQMHQKDNDKQNDFGLSERELEVLSMLNKGLLYKEISDRLNISPNTVKNHCKNIYKRLHVQNKVEAINKFRS